MVIFLRSVAEAVVQLLMETDVERLISAGRHERTVERAIEAFDTRNHPDRPSTGQGPRRTPQSKKHAPGSSRS